MISSFLATALLGAALSPPLAVPCPTTTLPVPLDRWRLEVFNNRSLTGSPVEARYDAVGSGGFAFDWGSGRGSECTGVDNFGIRFQRRIQLGQGGEYTFTATTDDGVRLLVDGRVVIDQWVDQSVRPIQGKMVLGAGEHDLRMEYYENGGLASAALRWGRTGDGGGACPTSPLAVPSDRWKLEVFNNRSLTGGTVEERYDAVGTGGFAFDWVSGRASACTGVDNFAVRFTRRIEIGAGGEYTFTPTTDDGVRLWVDGSLVIDAWVDQAATPRPGKVVLGAGAHDLRMEYYENAGLASAAIRWERTGGGGGGCPNAPLATPADRWKLEIFGNANLTEPSVEKRYEAAGPGGFDFDWGSQGPSVCAGADHFGIRFTRSFQIATSGVYRFTSRTDDGVRVWVDNRLVIDQWRDQSPTSHMGQIDLTAGAHGLRMDYYERQGGALASLKWEPVTTPGPGTGPGWDERLTTLGVFVKEAVVSPGTGYWKLVRARFESDGEVLPPPGGGSESRGTHYIYYRALDPNGTPIQGQRVFTAWPTSGPTNQVQHFTKGGGLDDYWGVFPMSGGWCPFYPQGGRGPFGAYVGDAPSDEVWGMGMPCNRHVSFRLTWQWTVR